MTDTYPWTLKTLQGKEKKHRSCQKMLITDPKSPCTPMCCSQGTCAKGWVLYWRYHGRGQHGEVLLGEGNGNFTSRVVWMDVCTHL